MYNQTAFALGSNRSCIRELFEYGRRRAAVVGDENIFDYSLGNPSIPAPREVEQTIKDILADTDPVQIHGYTSAVGDLQTRVAIAEDLNRRYQAGVKPENLFMGCGAAPELVAVFRALAVPGAEILAIAPYFPEYKPFVEGAGATFKVVAPDVPDFQVNLSEVEKNLTENTVAIIVNSPNNPSGTVYTAETLTALAELLKKKSAQFGHPIYIVADEPYRELTYGGVETPFIPCIYPDTIVCYSYSKALSLPGERIGYIYVPENATDSGSLYAAVAGAARASGHVCAPSMWQKVIARCTHLRPDLQAYDRNRQALYDGLTDAGYETARPDGAFYLFVKAPGGDAKAFSDRAKEKDLLVVPGDDFGCPGYFRLCYCVSHDKILRSLPIFAALMEEYK
ncbi:MAG: pyridoxal phosphate-dependent aminotransferase [Ruminococcaceae bacterium]|nr:pyridoxal phosphate-dependent aminotransferase [Oscillospiraceae bacterium]